MQIIKFFNNVQKATPAMVIVLYLHFSVCTSFSKPETLQANLPEHLIVGFFLKGKNQIHTHKPPPPKPNKPTTLKAKTNKHPPKPYAAWQSSTAVL